MVIVHCEMLKFSPVKSMLNFNKPSESTGLNYFKKMSVKQIAGQCGGFISHLAPLRPYFSVKTTNSGNTTGCRCTAATS